MISVSLMASTLMPSALVLQQLRLVLQCEEVAAYLNVWLLAGYLPTPLHCGQTFLIAKEGCTESLKRHHPITILDIIFRCFGPDRSEPIKVSQGVRQGDPLSISSMLPSTGLWTALIQS